jgi:TATA-box binding protein (TBP) (component of TFIID and TFIIIB)
MTIFKKTARVVTGPNPWEKSEEDVYRRIQQIRADTLKKNQVLARIIPILMISSKMLDAQILADQIAFEFEKTKNH